jgi:TPR repeat protein
MKRVAVNDPGAIFMLANLYYYGLEGLQQDHTKAMELYNRATELKPISAHYKLGCIYYKGGDLKKTKFHLEAAAMAGHEGARSNLGVMEAQSGNMERAVKHWIIAASSGAYDAMKNLIFNIGYVSRESIDSTLAAYNSSCAEIRSEARDLADLKWTELLGITSRLRNCEM